MTMTTATEVDQISKLKTLLEQAEQADADWLVAAEKEKDAEREARNRKEKSKAVWDEIHALLGTIHEQQRKAHGGSGYSGYSESRMWRLMSFWDKNQQKKGGEQLGPEA